MDVYCISLETHRDEWTNIQKGITQAGFLNPVIFPAINGYKLTDEVKQLVVSPWGYYCLENGLPRRYHAQLSSWGAVGCSMSHISLWQKLVNSSSDYMIIFEDDVEFNNMHWSDVSKIIPENFDIFFMGVSWEKQKGERVTQNYRRLRSMFFGTHAYIISKSCAKRMLKYTFPIEIQIDSFIHIMISLFNLNAYVLEDSSCGQKSHVSTIQQEVSCDSCYPIIDYTTAVATADTTIAKIVIVIGIITGIYIISRY